MLPDKVHFLKAQPVWLKNRENEMNLQVGFALEFNASLKRKYTLSITGSTVYRISVNGSFIHYGPARGPHGYVRVDELDLLPYLADGKNLLTIEVAGYNCNTYYTLKIPSFIQAELCEDNTVLHATGIDNHISFALSTRVQKAMRYSFQRSFTEIYHLDHADWLAHWTRKGCCAMDNNPELAVVDLNIGYLDREVPLPAFRSTSARYMLETGIVTKVDHAPDFKYLRHRFIHDISTMIAGYRLEEIDERPFETLQDCAFAKAWEGNSDLHNGELHLNLSDHEYVLLDMGLNNNGFVLSDITASEDSEIYFIFDEKLIGGKINFRSWSSINVIKYSLKKSEAAYTLQSFETYGFRYIMCFVLKGRVKLHRVGLCEYSYPHYQNTVFTCDNDQINAVYRAAVETYRQNTLDVFMDCPTRERAGWLCDSYFTASPKSPVKLDAVQSVDRLKLSGFLSRTCGYSDTCPA